MAEPNCNRTSAGLRDRQACPELSSPTCVNNVFVFFSFNPERRTPNLETQMLSPYGLGSGCVSHYGTST